MAFISGNRIRNHIKMAISTLRWHILLWAARSWAMHGMDQFERVKLTTPYGPVYLSLDVSVPYPNSFEEHHEKPSPLH